MTNQPLNIETAAYKSTRPKLKKEKAAEKIKGLYDTVPDEHKDTLTELYRFFLPAPAKKAKTLLEWVAKARSTDSFHPHLHHIYADDGLAVATDRHRLHMAPADGLKQGHYYHPNGAEMTDTSEMIAGFPENWRRVLPETHGDWIEINLADCKIEQDGHTYAYVRLHGVPGKFNYKYLTDAANGENLIQLKIAKDNINRNRIQNPITFRNTLGGEGVIMPIIL